MALHDFDFNAWMNNSNNDPANYEQDQFMGSMHEGNYAQHNNEDNMTQLTDAEVTNLTATAANKDLADNVRLEASEKLRENMAAGNEPKTSAEKIAAGLSALNNKGGK